VTRYYVSIEGLDTKMLEFFGFSLVKEDEEHALYLDGDGELQIVRKASPHIYVSDINDARHIANRGIMIRDV